MRRVSGVVMACAALVLGLVSARVASDQITAVVIAQWVFAVGLVAVSLVLTMKRPDNRFGFVVGWGAVGFAMMGAGQALGESLAAQGDFELAALWFKLEGVGWCGFILTVLVLLPLWFPTGRPAARFWTAISWGAVALATVAAVATVTAASECVLWDGPVGQEECVRVVDAPLGLVDTTLGEDLGYFLLFMALPAVVGLILRFARSSGSERQQLKWFMASYVALGVELGFAELLNLDIDVLIWPLMLLIPISVAIAILRYRLYDIDRIISRTVTYAIVVGLLAGGVALAATLVSTQFDSPLVVAATTLGVAAVFNPLRRRVQRWVDRRFNRSRYDAERVMDGFATSLRDEVDERAVVEGWQRVVSETMRPSSLSMWVRP